MSAPFFDKVDVFLPGHGQPLARAPAYRWRRSDRAVAHLYYSTTEPRSVLLHVAGLSRDEVRALAALPLQFDDSGSRHHDFAAASAVRTEVYDVVGGLDYVQMMFDAKNRVTSVGEAMQEI